AHDKGGGQLAALLSRAHEFNGASALVIHLDAQQPGPAQVQNSQDVGASLGRRMGVEEVQMTAKGRRLANIEKRQLGDDIVVQVKVEGKGVVIRELGYPVDNGIQVHGTRSEGQHARGRTCADEVEPLQRTQDAAVFEACPAQVEIAVKG